MNLLITGASGYIGSQLVHALQRKILSDELKLKIIAADIQDGPRFPIDENTEYLQVDVRSPDMSKIMREKKVDTVVHLATIVTPGKKSSREFEYSVDVKGTENVLEACVENDVKRIIVTSSGAAYGYHPDNPTWIKEVDEIRGNEEFAYSYHKRLVEEMLAYYRQKHPQLEQVIFRIGTILGKNVDNQITDLFKKPVILGISGSNSPFVFIWDQDVVLCLIQGIIGDKTGIYNVAGDGAVTIDELAAMLNKRVLRLPASLVKYSLFILKRLKLTQYGEEQINFLRYRPVLDNRNLKENFGFIPTYTSKEVFERYVNKNWEEESAVSNKRPILH